MKDTKKTTLIIIYACILAILFVTIITLHTLGAKERVGYLEVSENEEQEIANNSTDTDEYIYTIRIRYYDKVFRNSDIFGVYLNNNSRPEYIQGLNFEGGGSPYGKMLSSVKFSEEDRIEDITYTLKIKEMIINIYLYITLLPLALFIISFYEARRREIIISKKMEMYISLFILTLMFAFVFMMNIWQMPTADEWAQFRGKKDFSFINDGINSYLHWNARFGEMLFFKFFMNEVSSNIFVQQKIFAIVNTFVFFIFLLNMFFIVKGRYINIHKIKDSILLLWLFLLIYFSSSFNSAFVWQSGASNYGWALCLYSCFALPYRKLFDRVLTDKKDIKLFGLTLSYDSKYFSPKEILKAILFLVASVPIGMGNELTGPIVLIGLAIYTIYLVFFKKELPPLWFFMGGVGLFIGWLLLYFAPGPRKRNSGTGDYQPIHEQSIKTIFNRFKRFIGRNLVYSNLIVAIINIIIILKDKIKISKSKMYVSIVLFLLGFLGVAVASLLKTIPHRTYITFNIFFVIGNMIILTTIINRYTKQLLAIGFIIFTIFATDLNQYYKFNKQFTGYFNYIEEQKQLGVKDIKIYTKKFQSRKVGGNSFYTTRSWIQAPMAKYFGVDNIEFFDEDTKETYREQGL